MTAQSRMRFYLFAILNRIAECYPDLEPLRQDSDEDLLYKYFYWVDEYNEGYDPHHYHRPEFA